MKSKPEKKPVLACEKAEEIRHKIVELSLKRKSKEISPVKFTKQISKLLSPAVYDESQQHNEAIFYEWDYDTGEDVKQQIWAANHYTIHGALNENLKENGFPVISEIARHAKLSRKTVYKHLGTLETRYFTKEQKSLYKLSAINLLAQLYERSCKGDLKAMNLYFKWVERMDTAKDGNIKVRNLQVNFYNLPEEKRQAIEAIILDDGMGNNG